MADDDPADKPPAPVARSRRLTLPVSGSRAGSAVRPSLAAPGPAGATRIQPAKRFGLRVHRATLASLKGSRDDEGGENGEGGLP